MSYLCTIKFLILFGICNLNANVNNAYRSVMKKYPQWRIDAVIEEVAGRVYLSPRTVEAILSYEGIYAEN